MSSNPTVYLAPLPAGYVRTQRRVLTRRGVLWLGQTCNQRCYFCYFLGRIAQTKHPEHPFMPLDKAKTICSTLRWFYGNTSIDIQGGEPTIFPGIHELVRYCREIGLLPTLITNGLQLAKPGELERYQDAGIRDFLVSLHGLDDIHDEVVGFKGAYGKITTAIERMRALGIPFRFNCTMSKPVIPLLPGIAQKAIDYGALALNYIAFNPFEDQDAGIRTHENVPSHDEIRPRLTEAMDLLNNAGIEVNVRYLPICVAEPRHRQSYYNFQQLSYDVHEWDYQSWMWTGLGPERMRDGELVPPFRIGPLADRIFRGHYFLIRDNYQRHPWRGWTRFTGQRLLARAAQLVHGKDFYYRQEAIKRTCDLKYRYDARCEQCAARRICDGIHGDYADLFGTQGAVPITDAAPIDDPCHFIREQEKIVEPEEQAWAT